MRWIEGKLYKFQIDDDCFVACQLLKRPFVAYFNYFASESDIENNEFSLCEPLFIKAITKTVTDKGNLTLLPNAKPNRSLKIPDRWLEYGHRYIRYNLIGESETLKLLLPDISVMKLISADISDMGSADNKYKSEISANDLQYVEYESTSMINILELLLRLKYSRTEGRNVDPIRDLAFGLKPKNSYVDFYRMYQTDLESKVAEPIALVMDSK